MSDARPVYEQIDSIASFLKQGGPRKIAMRELMELSLFLRRNKPEHGSVTAPAVQPEPKQSGIPVEAGIAWQAGAFSTERKAVTVEGHAWYRHDHPSVKPAAQEQQNVAGADAVDAKRWRTFAKALDGQIRDCIGSARFGRDFKFYGASAELAQDLDAISQSAAAVPPVQAKEQK